MNDLLVLCYHAVSETWEADLSVTPERFERQLRLLVDRGYRGITFTEAVTDPPRGKAVAVTFDDAYRSVHEVALPIMSGLGLVGTVFIVTGFAGGARPMSWPGVDHWLGTPNESELCPVSSEQVRDLMEKGWEAGSHTRTHPRLSELGDDALLPELERSRDECEAITGTSCTSLAYPYGDFDARVTAAAEKAGYRAAGTLSARFKTGRALEWPRVGVYNGDGERRFRVKVSPGIRTVRSTALWDVADAARWAIRGIGRAGR